MRHVKQTATSAHQKPWTATPDDLAMLAYTAAGEATLLASLAEKLNDSAITHNDANAARVAALMSITRLGAALKDTVDKLGTL